MSAREFKPGDVAMLATEGGERIGFRCGVPSNMGWEYAREVGQATWSSDSTGYATPIRPLVVIDPEDREQVERLYDILSADSMNYEGALVNSRAILPRTSLQAALREFVNPTPPPLAEPTDPKARITDGRENVWRLLADGDWICVDGPDIGEYLAWWQLAERGPRLLAGDLS